MTREQYVNALLVERQHLDETGQTDRVVEVDAELARFGHSPAPPPVERAVPRRRK